MLAIRKYSWFKVLIVGLLSLGFATASLADKHDPLKVAFVYVGPTGDAGWTFAHDNARLYMEKKLGKKVKTTYVESVAEGADAERVITELARAGNKLIFTTSFGYMNPTLKVAKRFPEVKFEHASGYKRSVNVGTYFDRVYQGRYLTGM
ncbi:MAG: BMP family ABC transporter substrate-binding protein, partial [Porticoccaceae bacterium]|nr:BMP family ABC transporter substrate-binding protein [Porticoccaceae bacterium]